jgi:hypothetical protein
MKYTVEMASVVLFIQKCHEDWYRLSSNIKVFPQKFAGL